MAEKVGQKINKKSTAGKTIYKTPEGEMVSEKSVTIKFGENAYVNAPSIHDGIKYTEDEIRQMLLDGKIKPTSRHDTLEEAIQAAEKRSSTLMAEGGVPMKRQMELFDDGGLKDEGGTIDPISGNDVPPGSTQEEVRDDIPAQLSEGEFVFPADVVRYIGLEKLMQMRQQAKMGLQTMNNMGQMGNGDEAIIPDDIPFELTDLDIEDDAEYNVGGYVPPQQSFVPTYNAGVGFVPSVVTTPQPATVAQPIAPPVEYVRPQQTVTPTQPDYSNLTFQQAMTAPQAPRLEEIINPETGERRTINYIPGVTQLPDGFVLASEYTAPEKQTTTPTTAPTVSTTTRDKDDDDPDPLKQKLIANRIDAAKRMGFTDFLNPFTELASIFTPYGLGKGLLKEGQVTGTGYVVGKDNQLFDPASGKVVNQSLVDTAISFLKGESEDPGFSEEFFDIVPGPAGGQERKDRIAAQQAKAKATEDRLQKAMEAGKTRQSELAKIQQEKAKEIAQEKQKIAKIQEDAAKRSGGGSDKRSNLQKKSDNYTAKRVAEAVATGDYSRGFKEGGLASKKKTKPKKMRSGGLASKK